MSNNRRKKFYVDPAVQGALVARAAQYWLYSVAAVGTLTMLGWIFVSPGLHVLVASPPLASMVIQMVAIAVISAFLLLPFVLMDVSRHSNRFAGPMVRLRRSMEQLADGEAVEPIRFRDEDYWQDFATAFNRILARVNGASDGATSTPQCTSPPAAAEGATSSEDEPQREDIGSDIQLHTA